MLRETENPTEERRREAWKPNPTYIMAKNDARQRCYSVKLSKYNDP